MATSAMMVAAMSILVSFVCLIAVAALARELGALLSRLAPARPLASGSAGLELGTIVEQLSLVTARGNSVDIVPSKSMSHLLLFVSPTCPVCTELKSSILPFCRSYRDKIQVVIVTKSISHDEDVDLDRAVARYGGAVVENDELHRTMKVYGTPYCIVLDQDNKVSARGVVSTLDQLEALVKVEVFVPRGNRITAKDIIHRYVAPGR